MKVTVRTRLNRTNVESGEDMRVVKEAEERRSEILDAAAELFGSKGYEQTSTGDILEKVGIARGTLYYHFKSKEDILDAVIERICDFYIAKAAKTAGETTVPLLKRLPMTVLALNVETKIGHEIMEQVHKPQNALMHKKMQDYILDRVNPIITKLVEEGIEEGILKTDFPAEAVEMIVIYSNEAFDDINLRGEQELQKKVAGFIYNVERLLGTEQGALKESLMEIFKEKL